MREILSESDEKFRKSLLIESNIKDELKKHASNLFYVGCMVTELEDYHDRLKHELQLKEYHLTLAIRKSAKLDREKINESNISERVKVQNSYNELHDKFLKAKKALAHAKNKYKALLDKGENLRSIAFIKQAELKTLGDDKIKGE